GADTPVLSDVLTSGVWKPAGELQFFRSWSPTGTPQPSASPGTPQPSTPPGTTEPWVPYGHRPGQTGTEQDSGQTSRPPVLDSYPAAGGGQGWEWSKRAPESAPLPWEEMDRLGFLGGLTRTISLALRDSETFFRGVGHGRALMPALVFGLLMTAFSSLVVSAYELAMLRFFGSMIESTMAEMPNLFQGDLQEMMRWNLFGRGLALVLYPPIIFVFAGVAHFFVRLFGRPDADFATTFRMANYVWAIDALAAIPVCGYVIAAIWGLVLLIKGLSRLHRVGTLSALVAVLLALPIVIFAPSLVLALFRAVSGLGSSV
ncbi:MAG: hypothetical protein FJY88_11685, partial [Candidatus Eisenbacteria bacterium]|nr:hypothetical protein [Candidatus Eisenbacteria bacterium]